MQLHYHLLIYRREHLLLPAALWALFALLIGIFRQDAMRSYEVANAFLGFVLPLLAGILASAIIVDDEALELQLAAPRAPWRTLLERLALILALVAVTALAFQIYLLAMGVDISPLGSPALRQLAWLAPTLALMALGSTAALAFAQGTAGALLAGVVWITQLLLRGWFYASGWARYVFLFMAARMPQSPYLRANLLSLTALTVLLVAAGALLLRREEPYL